MRRLSKAAQWLTGSFIVMVMAVGTLLMFLGSGGDVCGNNILSESVSSDGKWKAVIFGVDCGATTTDKELRMAPRISVLPAQEPLSENHSGNVFEARTDGASKFLKVQANWTGAREVTVIFPADAAVVKQITKYQEVTVKYVPEPRAH
ncbi:MAG: hypothetical protein JWN42_2462 [Candidatus Angelobacter sp.]|nr:hypothetical protein [Candidatus Angelobacter sp.]